MFPRLEWFTAVDGKKLDIKDQRIHPMVRHHIINNIDSDYDHITSLGAIGCSLSHIELWKKCVELNEPIIVIEDDIKFTKDIIKSVKNSLSNIPKESHFLSLMFIPYKTHATGDKKIDK